MSESTKTKEDEQAEFDAQREQARVAQNLPPGAVPDQRPIASQQPDNPHSKVYDALVEAGDARAGNSGDPNVGPVHTKENYDKAASPEQAKKAAKESRHAARLYPGARGWVDNEGQPDHGRAIAVNGVSEWASVEDERIAAAGSPESRFAVVKSYECVSRDGRSELMIVSAEHIRTDTTAGAEWGKSPIMN